MSGRTPTIVFVAMLVFLLAVGQSALAAPNGARKPPKPSPTPTPTQTTSFPTPPTDLRITGLTSYSVSLSWTAATSSVGIQAYLLSAGSNYERAPGDATSWTFRTGIRPNNTYTLYVGALDNNNRNSQNSPFVTFTTPADSTPPTKPVVQVTSLGDKWVSLAWSTVEEGPVHFTVSRDGVAVLSNSTATSASFALQPQTTYTFAVEARDFAGFRALSDQLTVTTAAPIDDVTPPTPPGLFTNLWMPDGETWLRWTKSTDDNTPQDLIVYCIYINGVLENCQLYDWTIVYGVPMSRNTYTVTATDRHGNTSETSIEVDNF
ncbi:MAG TPA: fibronectin type III domain-containing protein [Candidatus Limnocylindria bacterium]|nr:fibronectin type III domain-containing protein [Candidatus Limnocylindria bacterium]